MVSWGTVSDVEGYAAISFEINSRLHKGNGQPLTMNPPGYVDIEDGEDEDDGAEDRGNDIVPSWEARRCF